MAFIRFNAPYKGKLSQVVPADKARKIQAMLDNPPDDITEEQGEFLLAIHKIYMGKPGRTPQPEPVNTDHMINPGVSQSMYDALPRNDR
jgi:hypothetical protein